MAHLMEGVTSMARSTLVLIGRKGTRTSPHLDRTEARNVAFGLVLPQAHKKSRVRGAAGKASSASPTPSRVLARWTLFSPKIVDLLNAYILEQFPATGWKDAFLTDDMVAAIKRASAQVPREGGEAHVIEIDQCAGQEVWVPPGCIHQVVNLEDCVKVAWDYLQPDHMHLYMQHNLDIGSGVIGSNAPDYVALASVFEVALRHWSAQRQLAQAQLHAGQEHALQTCVVAAQHAVVSITPGPLRLQLGRS